MTHIVLLGDSVFDNAAYVQGGPDVVRQLGARLGPDDRATLCAVDGHVTTNVLAQMQRVPGDATHLVVSVGGNDALMNMTVLEETMSGMAAALERLDAIGTEFKRNYQAMLSAVLDRALPTALCTIYDPRFPNFRLQRLAVTALALFNDVILREAVGRGLPVIDLRLVCSEDADYANPIEPSVRGGEKIAGTVARLVEEHDFRRRRTEIFAGP